LLDQWKWYEEAKRLMKDDLMTAWNDLEDWRAKLETPGRWMDGWTPDLIDSSDGWTLEVWAPAKGQMIPYRPNIDRKTTVKELMDQVNILLQPAGTFSSPAVMDENGQHIQNPTIEQIRTDPRLMVFEVRKSFVTCTDGAGITEKKTQWTIHNGVGQCQWFRTLTEDFRKRKLVEQWKMSLADRKTKVDNWKCGILEYAGIIQFLQMTLKDILDKLTSAQQNKIAFELQEEREKIVNRLEQRLLELVADERTKEAKRYVQHVKDRLRRSERTRESSRIGWFIHGCLTTIRTGTFGLTEDAGVTLKLLGSYGHSGGTDPHWTYIASPLVLAGKAEARGPDRLSSDCSQSEPQSHLPTGLYTRGPFVDFNLDLTRVPADSADLSVPSVHPEGRTEDRDGILPMVTSALEQNSRIPSQGSDRQPTGETSPSEDHVVVQEQAREATVRERRPTHVIRNMAFMMGGGQVWIYDANGVLTIKNERPKMIGRMAFHIANRPRRTQLSNDITTELRVQIRGWEQDESRRITQEQEQNMFLGTDGIRHYRHHLSPGARPDEATPPNGGIEEDQTHTRTLDAGLTGQRVTELGGITTRVVIRFAAESLGQPNGTRVSSEIMRREAAPVQKGRKR
jgi:hypothetical protein